MQFNESLRNLRKSKGLSQEELAEKMHVTRQTISKWENGSAMPDLRKLTELADLFEVSMDDLLGITVHSAGNTNQNTETNINAQVQYMETVAKIIEENQNQIFHRRMRNTTIAMVIIIICFVSALWIMQSNLSNQIQNLQNQINALNSNTAAAVMDADMNEYEEDASYVILQARKDKPYLLQVAFSYAPKNYVKNAKVYFIIPKRDGSSEKLEAKENNGVFKLTTDIDLTVDAPYYVYIDDGNNVTKEEIHTEFCVEYRDFNNFSQYICSCQSSAKHSYLTFENDLSEPIEWNNSTAGKIQSMQLIAESNGKVVYSADLPIQETKDEKSEAAYKVDAPNFTVEDISPNGLSVYFCAKDANGVEYRYYPTIIYFGNEDVSQYDISETKTVMRFDIDGKIIETPAY